MRGAIRNQKGFTLIELSIVLVIIGIILGAVLKGQDLIAGARAKKLTSTINQWTVSVFTFLDRKGRLPGDQNNDGLIGDVAAEQGAANSTIAELTTANFVTLPPNPVTMGGFSFWVYFGHDDINSGAANKNVMVICKDSGCATAFTADELKIIEAVDTSIDGIADAGLGQFRGATVVTLAGAGNVVTAVTGVDESQGGTSTAWGTTDVAAMYMFDRPF